MVRDFAYPWAASAQGCVWPAQYPANSIFSDSRSRHHYTGCFIGEAYNERTLGLRSPSLFMDFSRRLHPLVCTSCSIEMPIRCTKRLFFGISGTLCKHLHFQM